MAERIRELPHAVPIGPVADEDGNDASMPAVECPCGWTGPGEALLVDDDSVLARNLHRLLGEYPMFCPNCHRHGWEGWLWV